MFLLWFEEFQNGGIQNRYNFCKLDMKIEIVVSMEVLQQNQSVGQASKMSGNKWWVTNKNLFIALHLLSRRPEINFKGFSNTLATLFNYKSFAWIIFSTLFWNNSLKMKHSWCISLYKCFILQTFFWFYIEYIIYISTRFDEFTSI